MENYFPNLICDPEAHVTKLPFKLIDPLCLVMNNPSDKSAIKNYNRSLSNYNDDQINTAETFRIRNYIFHLYDPYINLDEDDRKNVFQYLKDRYVMGLLDKDYNINEFTISDANVTIKRSDTLQQMIQIAKDSFYKAKDSGDKELKTLMASWLKFVDKHEIYKILKDANEVYLKDGIHFHYLKMRKNIFLTCFIILIGQCFF
jgi:hypothetical protein